MVGILISVLLIGNHGKEHLPYLKRERVDGEKLNSISLSNTSRIDLASTLINSFAGIAFHIFFEHMMA